MNPEDQIEDMLDYIKGTSGQDLVIQAPCAAAQGEAPMNSTTETEEAGDGLG